MYKTFLLASILLFLLGSFLNAQEYEQKKWQAFFEGGSEMGVPCDKYQVKKILKKAEEFVGVKHCMGGYSKKCIDCSGLVKISLEAGGCIVEARIAEDLARYGKMEFNQLALKPGDLVFFTGTYKAKRLVSHAGIVIGNEEFIHTSSSKGVMVSSYADGYWSDHFIFGTKMQ